MSGGHLLVDYFQISHRDFPPARTAAWDCGVCALNISKGRSGVAEIQAARLGSSLEGRIEAFSSLVCPACVYGDKGEFPFSPPIRGTFLDCSAHRKRRVLSCLPTPQQVTLGFLRARPILKKEIPFHAENKI